jgi:FtsP/CotA-like multicopper oxidase with cupredoxin domain
MRFAVDEAGAAQMVFDNWNTDGMLGDLFTVNRKITPYLEVEPRKYRIRILNGGPSRFYQLFLRDPQRRRGTEHPSFLVITGDGNFLPEPLETQSLYFSVAQRVDVIMDFSGYRPGDQVFLHNLLQQINGAGPATRPIDPASLDQNPLDFGDPRTYLLRFDVVAPRGEDRSRIPDYFRPLPEVDLAEAKQTRLWNFDYDGGLWTINERIMDPNRIDAGIEQGSAEVWIFRNDGNDWAHPIHSHFTEFLILEVNGKPFFGSHVQTVDGEEVDFVQYLGLPPERRPPLKVYLGGPRRDVATLLPGDEIKVFMRWKDFLGKHVMHCHNVVHEDHAMMIRWDIVEPGRGFTGPRSSAEVYGVDPPPYEPPFPDARPPAPPHVEEHPGNPVQSEG